MKICLRISVKRQLYTCISMKLKKKIKRKTYCVWNSISRPSLSKILPPFPHCRRICLPVFLLKYICYRLDSVITCNGSNLSGVFPWQRMGHWLSCNAFLAGTRQEFDYIRNLLFSHRRTIWSAVLLSMILELYLQIMNLERPEKHMS